MANFINNTTKDIKFENFTKGKDCDEEIDYEVIGNIYSNPELLNI